MILFFDDKRSMSIIFDSKSNQTEHYFYIENQIYFKNNSLLPIFNLWNSTNVLGLDRIDISVVFGNPNTQIQFLLLIKIQSDNIEYLIINNEQKQIITFGDGQQLFGITNWQHKNRCLINLISIISIDIGKHLIICQLIDKTNMTTNSSYRFYHATIDSTIYRYFKLEIIPMEANDHHLSMSDKNWIIIAKRLEQSLTNFNGSNFNSINLWNNEIVVWGKDQCVIRSSEQTFVIVLESLPKPFLNDRKEYQFKVNSAFYQFISTGIILFSFLFNLIILRLLWKMTIQFADCFHNSNYCLQMEPIWLSNNDLM